jgi:chromate reductase
VSRILMISGSTRRASTNTALCRTAVLCAPPGTTIDVLDDLDALPHFNPDDDADPLPPAVAGLRRRIGEADAVVFCTPEYAGTLPGSFKNLLDWTVGGTELTGKPAAWIRSAADPRRGEGAHATLATVLGYVQAVVVQDACRHVPVARDDLRDGVCTDAATRTALADALVAVLA